MPNNNQSMNAQEKLSFFDPTDANCGEDLSHAALSLLEALYQGGQLDDIQVKHDSATRSRLERAMVKTFLALRLDYFVDSLPVEDETSDLMFALLGNPDLPQDDFLDFSEED